jgi:hypothetical protein
LPFHIFLNGLFTPVSQNILSVGRDIRENKKALESHQLRLYQMLLTTNTINEAPGSQSLNLHFTTIEAI